MPDRPHDGTKAPPRPADPPDPFLDDLDAHVTEEDLDPLDEWPDDEPLDDDFADEPTADAPDLLGPDDALEVGPDDDDGELPEGFEDEPAEEIPDAWEPVVLPWLTRAHLPEHDLAIEAVLDPTCARTRWAGGVTGPLRIVVGGVDVVVEPDVVEGAPALRIGRDVLAGRILVES